MMWPMKALAAAAICLLALLMPSSAPAALVSCSLSTSGVSFGSYDTLARTQVDAISSISVTCTGTDKDTVRVELSGGNTEPCANPRKLNSGTSASMTYQLYKDSGRSQLWCTGSGAISINFGFGSRVKTVTQAIPIYGRVLASQNPVVGTYSDRPLGRVFDQASGLAVAEASVPADVTVNAACALSVGTLGFGSYNPGTTATSSTTMSVRCTSGSSYNIALGAGQYAGGGTRRMLGPSSSYLGYELFSDAGRTTLWGDGASFGAMLPGNGTGDAQNITVHGRTVIGNTVRPGTYSDSVFVTVDY